MTTFSQEMEAHWRKLYEAEREAALSWRRLAETLEAEKLAERVAREKAEAERDEARHINDSFNISLGKVEHERDRIRAETIEQCAKVAENIANEFKDATDGYSIEGRLTGLEIATAIRALNGDPS